jgi:hypothetical protein
MRCSELIRSMCVGCVDWCGSSGSGGGVQTTVWASVVGRKCLIIFEGQIGNLYVLPAGGQTRKANGSIQQNSPRNRTLALQEQVSPSAPARVLSERCEYEIYEAHQDLTRAFGGGDVSRLGKKVLERCDSSSTLYYHTIAPKSTTTPATRLLPAHKPQF